MKRKLIDSLTKCGFAEGKTLLLQGTLNPDEAYPENFVTFWTDYTDDNSHYDDSVHSVDWHFSVIFYSSDPALVNTKPREITNTLRQDGFVPLGLGQDIASDEPTHTGWAMDFIYTEIL